MKKTRTIKVNITESDIEDLQAGVLFEWSFPSEENPNELITVKLSCGDDVEEETKQGFTDEEQEKLSEVLQKLEQDTYDEMFYRKINGAFVQAEVCEHNEEEFIIELTHGVQDENHSDVHVEDYAVNRKTFEIESK